MLTPSLAVLCVLIGLHTVSCNQPPKFENFQSVIFVKEDVAIGTSIGNLEASDPDDDILFFEIRGEIAKSILQLEGNLPKQRTITLKSKLDREVIDRYSIYFEVKDSAGNVIQRSTLLIVQDVNDNPPTFQNLPYRAEVPEDAALGTSVFKVTATDPDTGVGGIVTYNITSTQNMFAIDTVSGTVTLRGTLDYEDQTFYQLEIMAVDGGGLNSTTDLIVNVLDVQDTAPFFLNLPYLASVNENVPVGTEVLRVSAMDGDLGVPNPVNYTFISGKYDNFNIHPTSGLVTVSSELDREDPDILDLFGVLEMTVLTQEDTSTPKGPTTATTLVTIRILDVNDQTPTFSSTSYTATVLENTQARIPVSFTPQGTEMLVTDYDEGINGTFELYVEKDGSPFNVFEVVPNKVRNEGNLLVRVKNSTALDYEQVTSYTFEVVARENLTPERREGRTSVTVNIEDVNDNYPVFDSDIYHANISENSARGTPVVTITATDEDSGVWGEVSYNLKGISADLFKVEPNTGAITVNVDADQDLNLLDRETIDTHYITYEAIDGGGLRTSVQLQITLLDVNDNAPQIVRPNYEGYIREGEAQLERELKVEAIDIDLTPNNIIKFSIVSGDPLTNFTIGEDDGVIGVTGPLNYESMDPSTNGVYELQVEARDMGTPSLSSTVSVTINVQDMNDNAPYFDENLYTTSIPENSTPGTEVITVHAKDDDGTAPNNEVIYRIESGAKDRFRVDAETGAISVEVGANLDRDLYGSEYTLNMLAIDRGNPSLSGQTVVKITITDINNKHPVFDPSIRFVSILENTTVGTEFFTYTATDLDENSLLRYRLLDNMIKGEDEDKRPITDTEYLKGLFGIHDETGIVYVKGTLDRETVEEVTLTVFVADLNAEQPPIQNATATLVIQLVDVNDNPPMFLPTDFYTARISEASRPGIEVKQVLAIDKDKNPDPVKYYLMYDTAESESFEITDSNRETGIVTLKSKVEHEDTPFINITIRAVDAGVPPLESLAKLYIEVEDVNDNSPEWKTFPEMVEVWENSTLSTVVTQVEATDRDSGEFGRVMYFIVSGGDGKFHLNNTTGVITTADNLNREDTPTYTLTIEARDNNFAAPSQQLKTSGYMTIKLLDVNDNAPVFDQSSYSVELQENAKPDTVILTVKASDADEGINAEITYSVDFPAGNATDLFDIHPTIGEIFVNRALKGNAGYYYIMVKATDGGSPSLSNTTTVYFYIEDVNDHRPVIEYPPLNKTIYIMENVPIGYFVDFVSAVDLDEGINGMVQYDFVRNAANTPDWQKFDIEISSGNITTADHIDREEQETYYLEVRAYDLGKPSYEDRRTLKIVALDEDDNPPEFDREKYPPPHKVTVKEEHSDVYVANISFATDPDIGNNSMICYYLVGGDMPYKEQFHINKTTGGLWLGPSIDREEIDSLQLIVKASEDCWSDFWEREENTDQEWDEDDLSLLLVQVNIEDINDNPPRFEKNWFSAGVTKDTQFGSDVINIANYASDPDIGNNSILFYSIIPPFRISEPLATELKQRGENDPFTMGRRDGIIRTNIYFQQNMQGYIEFEVKVEDINPLHVATTNVSINLLNESQRVKIILRGDTEEVGKFKDVFAAFLSNVTKAVINVDLIRTHQDKSGKPDPTRTDMFLHAIDPKTGAVMDAAVLINLIDQNNLYLVDFFKTYNVIEVLPAVEPPTQSLVEQDLQLALILAVIPLACLFIIILTTFLVCRRKYKRKLKAATAVAFGSRDTSLNHMEMPGTNMHTFEGSNPIWLEKYENGWPKDTDTDSRNSVDENELSSTPIKNGGYDTQEMSMQMHNNEFDHYNKGKNNVQNGDADIYLKAALKERDLRLNKDNSPHKVKNGFKKTFTNGNAPANGLNIDHNKYGNNEEVRVNNMANLYDNHGFEMQATEI